MKTVAIIQARLGSQRLPGKVLRDLCGEPVLRHVIRRTGLAAVDEVVVATCEEELDDARGIEMCAEASGVSCLYGHATDVLDRYYQAAKEFQADTIVRVTADCPLVDPGLITQALALYADSDADYCAIATTPLRYRPMDYFDSRAVCRARAPMTAHDSRRPLWPDGVDCEIFSVLALKKAWTEAYRRSHREHVSVYLWANPRIFDVRYLYADTDLSKYRFTVDTEEDFAVVTAIVAALGPDARTVDIVAWLDAHPAIYALNRPQAAAAALAYADLR